jgi:choline dehydrogenase-like flavoprotein
MIKQGGGGRIINITSVHEDWPMPGNTAYCLAKGGMRMLTRTAGLELAGHNILVVGVGPGAVATPINLSTMNDPAKLAQLDAAIPLGRMARPEEIASVVGFLAGDGASYLTATTIFADGGIMHSIVAVRPALEFPNVTLFRNAKALKLETNADGTAIAEVVVEVGGEREVFRGDIVVVSCGAANTAKLLLMSANDKHPNGLANGSDQVGRNYMFHNSQAVLALSREPNTTIFQKTIALNDFYFGMDGFEYPMGNIQMIGKSLGPMYRGEKPLETALLPMGVLGDLARHAVDFWLSTEDLPDPENRVTVDRSGKVTLSYTPNNQVPTRKLYDQLKSMLSHLGMHPDHLIPRNVYMKTEVPIAGCAHQAGTCRFGSDAKTSVLDRNCKAHELDNLYVVDTSFFVSIGAVNPSLTAIANAIRVGDHLLQRLA